MKEIDINRLEKGMNFLFEGKRYIQFIAMSGKDMIVRAANNLEFMVRLNQLEPIVVTETVLRGLGFGGRSIHFNYGITNVSFNGTDELLCSQGSYGAKIRIKAHLHLLQKYMTNYVGIFCSDYLGNVLNHCIFESLLNRKISTTYLYCSHNLGKIRFNQNSVNVSGVKDIDKFVSGQTHIISESVEFYNDKAKANKTVSFSIANNTMFYFKGKDFDSLRSEHFKCIGAYPVGRKSKIIF